MVRLFHGVFHSMATHCVAGKVKCVWHTRNVKTITLCALKKQKNEVIQIICIQQIKEAKEERNYYETNDTCGDMTTMSSTSENEWNYLFSFRGLRICSEI